jgi:hypothetical protein
MEKAVFSHENDKTCRFFETILSCGDERARNRKGDPVATVEPMALVQS